MILRYDRSPVADDTALRWFGWTMVGGAALRSWIPDVFERYARILHPAERWTGGPTEWVRWKELSAWSGKPLAPTSSVHDLALRDDGATWPGPETERPLEGQLQPPHMDHLLGILAGGTASPTELWLLVWNGYGTQEDLSQDAVVEIHPSWHGFRAYFLFRGSFDVSEVNEEIMFEPPSFWWPEDRAWFVSTDIDASSTYVGGSSALIGQLMSDDLLEVLPAELDDPFDGPPFSP